MKTYINKMASYKDAPIQRTVQYDGLNDYIEKNIKVITRTYKERIQVHDIEKGDIVVIDIQSHNSKLNRNGLKLGVGSYMFDKDLEDALIGLTVSQQVEINIRDIPVKVKVLESVRNVYPQITNQMISQYTSSQEGLENIKTVDAYKDYLTKQYKNEMYNNTLNQNINEIMNYVLTHTDFEFDEEEVQEIYDKYMQEINEELSAEGKTLEGLSKNELKLRFGFDNLRDTLSYVKNMAEWYIASNAYLYVLLGENPQDYPLENLIQEDGWGILQKYVQEQMENVF